MLLWRRRRLRPVSVRFKIVDTPKTPLFKNATENRGNLLSMRCHSLEDSETSCFEGCLLCWASSLLIFAMVFPLTTPSPGINYNFVSGAYLVCSVILAVLLALDKVFGVEAIEGAWVVFAPFPPCLAWALAMRTKWLAARDDGVKTKAD